MGVGMNMIHINLSKYSPGESKMLDIRDVYFKIGYDAEIKFFVTVDNGKRGVFIVEYPGKQTQKYEILYINLLKNNKVKNPNHPSMLKPSSLSFSQETPRTPKSMAN